MILFDWALVLTALALVAYLLWLLYRTDPRLGCWLRGAAIAGFAIVALHPQLWSWSWLLVIAIAACVAAVALYFVAWAIDEVPRWWR